MLKTSSQVMITERDLLGKEVFASNGVALGAVRAVKYNDDLKTVGGFYLERPGLAPFIHIDDVLFVDEIGIYLTTMPLEDLLGQEVLKNGEHIGRVVEILSEKTGFLLRIETPAAGGDRLIPLNHVKSVDPQGVQL